MKQKLRYYCSDCRAESVTWFGKCKSCGKQGTATEFDAATVPAAVGRSLSSGVLRLSDLTLADEPRFSSGFDELDYVLGGGYVVGELLLIGGDPGIGKSTLLLQTCGRIAKTGTVLYVSGEESPKQVRLRAERLDLDLTAEIYFAAETNLTTILAKIAELRPAFVVIDSIQTISLPDIQSTAGSVSQVRECTLRLMDCAKSTGTTIVIVGHVTKDGMIAGPKTLEHMVDAVLYFEGEADYGIRILRAVKNRFGAAGEVAVFEMTGAGLKEVSDPTGLFITSTSPVSGSAISVALEGSRPMLLEVQALVSASAYGTPRRTVLGADYNRVQLVTAILEKKLQIPFGAFDIFVSIVGGIKVSEPALDLAIAAALLSSHFDQPLPEHSVFFGELSLTGEIRPASNATRRASESAKFGKIPIAPPVTGTKPQTVSEVFSGLVGQTKSSRELL